MDTQVFAGGKEVKVTCKRSEYRTHGGADRPTDVKRAGQTRRIKDQFSGVFDDIARYRVVLLPGGRVLRFGDSAVFDRHASSGSANREVPDQTVVSVAIPKNPSAAVEKHDDRQVRTAAVWFYNAK